MSSVFKALSDPTRRSVLQLLRTGPMSAGQLCAHFDVSKPTMSAHFAVLKGADLIHAEKAGKSINYHLKLSVLEQFPKARFTTVKGIKLKVPQHHRADLEGTQLVLTTQVPSLRHNRPETGFDWSGLAKDIRR